MFVTLQDEGFLPEDKDELALQVVPGYSRVNYGTWTQDATGAWSRTVKVSTWFLGQKVGGRAVQLTGKVLDENGATVAGWENSAPLDAATGTTDANGVLTTVQRWNPVEAGTWPHDFKVEVETTH